MFIPTTGILELVARGAIVYVGLFVLLRVMGKRHVGDLAPFDLVVLLILSECVQNALVGDEKSITGGFVVVATLLALSTATGFVTWRSKRLERFIDGTPRVLVRNGKVDDRMLARERITRSELMEALRQEGCTSLKSVRFAVLENDGAISIGLRADRQGANDA
jgi:uncharacterized membrane protein YcaP (DUF421 family)